jgi:hypothetical protein
MAQVAQPADIVAVQALLKEVYPSDKVEEQVVKDRTTLSELENGNNHSDEVGDKAIGFVRTRGNKRSNSRSLNGGTLGAPGRQVRKRWEYDYTAHYIQIKILGATIAKMRTRRQAAVNEVDDEVDNAIEDRKDDLSRQLFSDGSALIAQCGTTTASTTVVLNAAAAQAIEKGWLQEDMYVDIGTTADEDSVVADALITAVNPATPSITIDSSVTTSSSHYVSIADNRSGTTSYEMNGLAALASDTTVLGAIDPSSERTWKGQRVNVAGALSQAKLQDLWIQHRKVGSKPDKIVTSFDHQRDYYNTLQSQVRFAGDSNLTSGHVEGPDFNGVIVEADQDCPDGLLYMYKKAHVMLFKASGGIQWQNVNTGGDILAWVQDEDAFQARAAFYGQVGTDRRNAIGVGYGIT